jgi:hypothetical protein
MAKQWTEMFNYERTSLNLPPNYKFDICSEAKDYCWGVATSP